MAAYYAALRIIERKRKRELIHKKILKDFQNPFFLDEEIFKEKFGFNQKAVEYIHDLIAPIMKRHQGYPIALQILTSLQILRSGSFQHRIGFHDEVMHMSQASISRKFDIFLDALMDVAPKLIEFPSLSELTFSEPKYYGQSKISNIIGILHCFSVFIHKPKTSFNEMYCKKEDKYSLNVQLVCDSNLYILDTISSWPGSTPNSDVWKNSSVRNVFKNNVLPNRCFLVGDSSFPLEPWLLVPYEDCLKTEELVFNDHVHRALDIVKRCVATLKSRFKCLNHNSKRMYYSPEKCSKIVMACMVLHNIALQLNINVEESIDIDINRDNESSSSQYLDTDSNIQENILRNEAMSIRDEVSRQLLAN